MQHPAELPPFEYLLVCLGTAQASVLKTMFDAIWSLTVNGNLLFFPGGFRICNATATHVTFVNLPADRLDTYHYGSTKSVEPIGVDFAQLWQFIKTLGQRDTVYIYVDKREPDKLCILKCDAGGTTLYTVSQLVLDEEIYERPPFEGRFFTITYPAAQLQATLKGMRNAGAANVQFLARRGSVNDDLYIVGASEDINVTVKRHDPIPHASIMQPIINCGDSDSDSDGSDSGDDSDDDGTRITKPSSTKPVTDSLAFDGIESDATMADCDKADMYSLTHLMYMVKVAGISTEVRLYLREKFPLLMSFTVGDLGQIFYAIGAKHDDGSATLSTLRVAERRSATMLGVESLADQQAEERDDEVRADRKRRRRDERATVAKKTKKTVHAETAKKARVWEDSASEAEEGEVEEEAVAEEEEEEVAELVGHLA